MALTISDSGSGNFETIAKGRYKATCYRIVDVGTHNETYEGETKSVTVSFYTGNLRRRCQTANLSQS